MKAGGLFHGGERSDDETKSEVSTKQVSRKHEELDPLLPFHLADDTETNETSWSLLNPPTSHLSRRVAIEDDEPSSKQTNDCGSHALRDEDSKDTCCYHSGFLALMTRQEEEDEHHHDKKDSCLLLRSQHTTSTTSTTMGNKMPQKGNRQESSEEYQDIDIQQHCHEQQEQNHFIGHPFKFEPSSEQIQDCKNAEGKMNRKFSALQSFYRNLNEVHTFKLQHGKDAEIPQKGGKLGNWTNKMRQQKRRYDKGEPSSLNELKIRQLEQAGFTWGIERGDKLCFERFEQFCKHARNCGPLVNTRNTGDVLGRWVSTQRAEYKKLKMGKKSTLNEERVKLLTQAGFVWRVQRSSDSSSSKTRKITKTGAI